VSAIALTATLREAAFDEVLNDVKGVVDDDTARRLLLFDDRTMATRVEGRTRRPAKDRVRPAAAADDA
jgi:hypothetical protein